MTGQNLQIQITMPKIPWIKAFDTDRKKRSAGGMNNEILFSSAVQSVELK